MDDSIRKKKHHVKNQTKVKWCVNHPTPWPERTKSPNKKFPFTVTC